MYQEPRERKTMDKNLILIAYKENWGLIGAGDWHCVTWRIFSDGSYSVMSKNVSEDGFDDSTRRRGKMRASSFQKLLKALSCEWDGDLQDVGGCDGVAWAIEQYDENGEILRNSGPLGYIYGKERIERIIKLLPHRACAYYEQ